MLKRKKLFLIPLGILVVMLIIFLFQIRPLPTGADEIKITVISSDVTTNDFAAFPDGDVQSFLLSEESEDSRNLYTALAKTHYSFCFHSLGINEELNNSNSDMFLIRYGNYSIYLSDSEHIILNGKTYKLVGENHLYDECLNLTNIK